MLRLTPIPTRKRGERARASPRSRCWCPATTRKRRSPRWSRFPRGAAGRGIYVYDNNSTDRTIEAARAAGAVVRRETHQGKGHVVRRMFADIDADVYVLVDGDATYDAPSARAMIAPLVDGGSTWWWRARRREEAAYRPGHRTGNRLLTGFVARMFGQSFTDMLSGYRVFSRRFVKSFPVLSGGFEIETELTVHALELECRSPRCGRRITRGPTARPRSSTPGATASASSGPSCKLYRTERPLRFSLRSASRSRGRDRAAIPIVHDISADRHRAAVSDRDLSTGLMLLAFLAIRRAHPRYGHARPPRDEAARLSAHAAPGESAGE